MKRISIFIMLLLVGFVGAESTEVYDIDIFFVINWTNATYHVNDTNRSLWITLDNQTQSFRFEDTADDYFEFDLIRNCTVIDEQIWNFSKSLDDCYSSANKSVLIIDELKNQLNNSINYLPLYSECYVNLTGAYSKLEIMDALEDNYSVCVVDYDETREKMEECVVELEKKSNESEYCAIQNRSWKNNFVLGLLLGVALISGIMKYANWRKTKGHEPASNIVKPSVGIQHKPPTFPPVESHKK